MTGGIAQEIAIDYLRAFIGTLILRLIWVRRPANLLGCESVDFAGFRDHLAHFADASGALHFALIALENLARAGGAGLDRARHVALSQAITVTHVQSGPPRASVAIGSL